MMETVSGGMTITVIFTLVARIQRRLEDKNYLEKRNGMSFVSERL